MSFFKSLFGTNKKKTTTHKKSTYTEDKEFTAFFYDAYSRYTYTPKGTVELVFKNKKGIETPPSVAFIGGYRAYKQISSIWDQRSELYKSFDDLFIKRLEPWMLLERFITDRRALLAIKWIGEHATDAHYTDANFLTSVSRAYFFMSTYDTAISFAEKALEIDPNLYRAKIALADAMHLSNEHDFAHDLYLDVLNSSSYKEIEKKNITLMDIVGFENQILPSSVYAVSLLNNDEIIDTTWDEVATEFYHCPYFRCQHAFWLLKNKENLSGLAKLISLTQEFPWYKEGVINAHSSILQFREQMKTEDLWVDEFVYLEKIIQKNNWEPVVL